MRLNVRSLEEAVVNCVRSGECIPDGEDAEQDKANDNVNAGDDDLAFAQDEVPDRRARVLWHAKTPLDADGNQAAAASVHRVLRQEVENRADDEA